MSAANAIALLAAFGALLGVILTYRAQRKGSEDQKAIQSTAQTLTARSAALDELEALIPILQGQVSRSDEKADAAVAEVAELKAAIEQERENRKREHEDFERWKRIALAHIRDLRNHIANGGPSDHVPSLPAELEPAA